MNGYGAACHSWDCVGCGARIKRGDPHNGPHCFTCDDANYRAARGYSRAEGFAVGRRRMAEAWERRRAAGRFRTNVETSLRNAVGALTKKAVRLGLLPCPSAQSCEDCGEPAQCYDHRDYSRPFEVAPVCLRCNSSRGKGDMPEFWKVTKADLRPDIFGRPRRPDRKAAA